MLYPFSCSTPGPRSAPQTQRGHALISALLALIITGLGAVGYTQARQLEIKLQMAQAEATVLEKLRDAVNNAIFANATAILQGQPITHSVGGVSLPPVTPQTLNGQLVWQPTLTQLRDMGYLPAGWTLTRSSLNDQDYQVQFRRTLPCAAPPDCNIEGTVTLMGPLTAPGTGNVDGTLIGPILTRLGVDSAVSLMTTPNTLTGWDHTWSTPNPVVGQPAGVVAVRVGTAASTWAAFVRRGDLRDPNLAGNLSAQGNLTINGSSRFNGAINSLGAIDIGDGTTACSRLEPTGVITLTCAGSLNAVTGAFSQGVTAGSVSIGAAAEPNAIRVSAGDLLIRAGSGLVRIAATGDLQTSGGVTSGDTVIAPTLRLNASVNEGETCIPSTLATLVGGGIASCTPGGVYRAVMKYGAHRGGCSVEGSLATDQNSGEGLLCRGGRWMVAAPLMSGYVQMASWVAVDGTEVPMPACRDTGSVQPEPKLFLHAGAEATPDGTIVRSAAVSPGSARGWNSASGHFEGGAWVVELRNGFNAALPNSSVLATTYCFYQ